MPDRWETGRGEGVEAGRRPNMLLTGARVARLGCSSGTSMRARVWGLVTGRAAASPVPFLSPTCFPVPHTLSQMASLAAEKQPRVLYVPLPIMFLFPSSLSPTAMKRNFWPYWDLGADLPGSPLNIYCMPSQPIGKAGAGRMKPPGHWEALWEVTQEGWVCFLGI